jgi:hypothetical protein
VSAVIQYGTRPKCQPGRSSASSSKAIAELQVVKAGCCCSSLCRVMHVAAKSVVALPLWLMESSEKQ